MENTMIKKITISCLLAAMLGLVGCKTTKTTQTDNNLTTNSVDNNDTNSTTTVQKDKTAPQFININTNPVIMENSGYLQNIFVKDESSVEFKLEGDDAESFTLNSTKSDDKYVATISLKSVADFETKQSYSITIVATDSEQNSASKDITLQVLDEPFSWDITSSMGQIMEDHNKTITLATKEAKSNVTYGGGGGEFLLSGDQLTFIAPAYVDGGDNKYTTTIIADDGNTQLELNITAQVYKDGTKPSVKNYLLEESEINILHSQASEYVKTKYFYNSDGYLEKIEKSGSGVVDGINGRKIITFEYSNDKTIMRSYNQENELASIRVFEDKKTQNHKVVANLYTRFSVDEYINFLDQISDTVEFRDNKRLTKYIYGLDRGQTKAEIYIYNDDDSVNRILVGNYISSQINSSQIASLSDEELKTAHIPTGGFPSNSKLTPSQIASLKSGIMPFDLNQETIFRYVNGSLVSRKLVVYNQDTNGSDDEVKSDDIDIDTYSDGVIKKIVSGGLSIEYDPQKLLKRVNNETYSYIPTGTKIKINVNDGTQTVSTYTFKEE